MNTLVYYLKKDLPEILQKANHNIIDDILAESKKSSAGPSIFVLEYVQHLLDEIKKKNAIHEQFTQKIEHVHHSSEVEKVIIEFAQALGATPQEIEEDQKALKRWLDFDALSERCLFQIGRLEQKLLFLFMQLPYIFEDASKKIRANFLDIFIKLSQEYEGSQEVRVAVMEAFLKTCPPEHSLKTDIFITLASSLHSNVWIQTKALDILKKFDRKTFQQIVKNRLTNPGPDPDLFVRQHVVTLIEKEDLVAEPSLLQLILNDSSDFVRQSLAERIELLGSQEIKHLSKDKATAVRGMLYLKVKESLGFDEKALLLKQGLSEETDLFVLKVILKCVREQLLDLSPSNQKIWIKNFHDDIRHLQTHSKLTPIRRLAAYVLEIFWSVEYSIVSSKKDALHKFVENLPLNKLTVLPPTLYKGLKEEELARLLSLQAYSSFDISLVRVKGGFGIYKGIRLKLRMWRFIYEFLHPKTNKREDIQHTLGRKYIGSVHMPSSILAEQADTQVPGEPLYLYDEEGYRPFLPLLDLVLSSLRRKQTTRIFTSEGITKINPPTTIFSRIKAWLGITLHFAKIARLRNWSHESHWKPNEYTSQLKKLGFTFELKNFEGKSIKDSQMTKFFPALAFFPDSDTVLAAILSPYQLHPLAFLVFLILMYAYFLGVHIYTFRKFKKIRSKLRLVLGGWGTRGKTSMERLKVAVLQGLGKSIFSKTTGSASSISFGAPFQRIHTVWVFRPYEKASIWEQQHITEMSTQFHPDLVLWECMGLRPNYVRIMQEEWMQDDLLTITNAFPDHEDRQGPAGHNVAQSIASFIKPKGLVLTAEEQMLPYIKQAAQEKEAHLENIGWLERGLLTEDVLKRVPYVEHPLNIVLALEVAKKFAIPRSKALKAVADNVVPDIGALERYPTAKVNSRELEFFNLMSANEEYSFLNSWKNLGLGESDPEGTWVTSFINNRRDRAKRSESFAQIIVNNISAHKHFIVGTNTDTFMRFVREEWNKFLTSFLDNDFSLAKLDSFTTDQKICVSFEQVALLLKAMGVLNFKGDLDDISVLEDFLSKQNKLNAKKILYFHKKNLQELKEYEELTQRIHDRPFIIETLTNWFLGKFLILEQDNFTGDQYIQWIVENTPPHYVNKIVGVQNIKGPGLELIDSWQNWDECYQASRFISNQSDIDIQKGYQNLTLMPHYSILAKDFLFEFLNNLKSKKINIDVKALRNHITNAFNEQKLTKKKTHSVIDYLVLRLIDINYVMTRYKIAQQIYKDLSHHRISFYRAHEEIEKLAKQNE